MASVTGAASLRVIFDGTVSGTRGRYGAAALAVTFGGTIRPRGFSVAPATEGSLSVSSASTGSLTLTPSTPGSVSL